jgi:hypothetical protein
LRLVSGKGARLEGHGVVPDEPQTLETNALNLGRDSQFDRALSLLKEKLGEGARPRQLADIATH